MNVVCNVGAKSEGSQSIFRVSACAPIASKTDLPISTLYYTNIVISDLQNLGKALPHYIPWAVNSTQYVRVMF